MGYGEKPSKVIIASIPRTGSTYLLRSILGLPYSGGTPPGYYKKKIPYVRPNVVITHSYPQDVIQDGWKVILTFGDPIQSVISTRHKRWDKHHFENCGVYGVNPNDCDNYTKDVLHYEHLFDSWYNQKELPMLCIRYETMDKYFKQIEEWVGRKINFIPWKIRKGNVTSDINLQRIKLTYRDFIDKVNKMPDICYKNLVV